MLKKINFKLIFILIVIIAIIKFINFNSNKIDIGAGLNTGMTKIEVENKIGDNELVKFKNKEGIVFFHWKNTETFLAFTKNNILIYKLVIFKTSYRNSIINYFLKKGYDGPINVKEGQNNILVFKKENSIGVKIKESAKNNTIQVWIGSIKLWNDHTKKHKIFIPFPLEKF